VASNDQPRVEKIIKEVSPDIQFSFSFTKEEYSKNLINWPMAA
jgi:hypothetical protein